MLEVRLNREAVAERGKRLEYFTIAWNSLEGLVALIAGAFAGSISLVGFGIDSFIEVTSGSTLLWRMSVDAHQQRRERNEKLSLRIVGLCFLALAAYVGYESISDLVSRKAPEHSIPGIILACVSLVVMPLLSRAKKKIGNELASAAMHADARQTDFCVYLSAILLIGLLLNAGLGWWADPIAGLVMVPIITKEGVASGTPEARVRQAATQLRHAKARSAWSLSSQPAWLTTEIYSDKIQPLLKAMSSSSVSAHIGVSRWYAGRVRRGYRPHPRHWKALAELVSVSGG